jgi:hypothetical protein
MLYLPSGQPVRVDFSRLTGKEFQASWFDPRSGAVQETGRGWSASRNTFSPPAPGEDWVLVIDSV